MDQVIFGRIDKEEVIVAKPYDLDLVLSLDLIREHTKTDDVPSVTDAQLKLYRKAALEAAEAYTSLLLTRRKVVFEDVDLPGLFGRNKHRGFHQQGSPNIHKYTTKYAFGDPVAYWYGLAGFSHEQITVEVNSHTARLPLSHTDFGMGCCSPCGNGGASGRLQYVAGFACEDDFPAAIALGALKYIAHVIENLGDNIVVVNSRGGGASAASASDPANPALASGAIDIWRSVIPDAF